MSYSLQGSKGALLPARRSRILNAVPHYAYIARCADGSLYVGTCVNLAARETMHNAGKASKYTRSRLPVAFVYHEEHPTLSAVRKREAAMKKLSRDEKLALIGG